MMNYNNIYAIVAFTLLIGCNPKENTENAMSDVPLTYLALGDSYTIGEGVEEGGRYPNQTVSLLHKKGYPFEKPTLIAKTGWTTDELQKGIAEAEIAGKSYDLVTLLIGVNNQYRGRALDNYENEFRSLLEQAIRFANNKPNHVVVISIPDWGITPFAEERNTDRGKVSREIDLFNASNQILSEELGVHYIEITTRYRAIGAAPKMLVDDKLHPSSKVYAEWAEHLSSLIFEKMNF